MTNPYLFPGDPQFKASTLFLLIIRSNRELESYCDRLLCVFAAEAFADWLFVYSGGPRCNDDASGFLAHQLDIEGKLKI